MAPRPRIKGQITEHEKELFENLNKEKGEINLEVIRQLLGESDVDVDCLDDHGMTPLQHAAFKNNKELCEVFLSHGADVNCNEHENGYTTLMFAALSGNTTITKLMLEAGAKTSPTNSVGRTASQMAAFVGQHACVSLINNFFSIDELAYYTKPQGFEKEPKLLPVVAPALHKLILFNNLNPVKLSQYIQNTPELFNESARVAKVLDCICEKQIKGAGGEPNDVLSIKMHYLACVMRACQKWDLDKEDGITGFIKYLLRGRETDGVQLGMEKFIRDSIKDFPYHESQLLQEMVRNIAGTNPGDDPSALIILTQGINGSRSVDMDTTCMACGESKAQKKCSACKMVMYCSQACQKLHWFTHKKACKNLAKEFQKISAAKKEMEEREKKEEAERERKEQEVKEQQKQEDLSGAATTEGTTDVCKETDISDTAADTNTSEQNVSKESIAKPVSASDVEIENIRPTDGGTLQNGDRST